VVKELGLATDSSWAGAIVAFRGTVRTVRRVGVAGGGVEAGWCKGGRGGE
jgi:molybdopterin synthase catalytic subunit